MSDIAAIAERLYIALRSMPCRCQMTWKDKKPDYHVTLVCGRCLALKAYEVWLGDVAA